MSIRDEKLWKILVQKAREDDKDLQPDQRISNEYLSGITEICQFGVDRAKTIRDTFPMYTLHDETHICNVLRIMDQLLGDHTDKLTRDEAAMLVLAACCHDVGMSYSDQEKQELLDDRDRIDQYLEQHHDEYVKAYKTNPDEPTFTDEMLRKYLRSIHHERISELLNRKPWPECLRGKVDRKDLVRVCQSHGDNPSSLNDLGCTPTVDLRFCAVLLRLADILDFDTIRAPKAVYDYCGFNDAKGDEAKYSKTEWEKHLTSQGFDFIHVADRSVPYDLPYHATSKSMQIEQAVNSYLDWVDSELNECGKLLRRYVGEWQDFILPNKILRTIETEGYVSGQYHLTMDQNKVMELLVGEELYSDPSAFVRELIQNAIDAVRTREQLDKQLPKNWNPQINIRSWIDMDGYHWFRIEDNGTGMTKEIIENYFLKIGKSYYTSDTFQKDKIRCGADPDYTPISRFGIGILSCFMGGKESNQVEVSTKRFAADGGYPSALRLSMHGMNGYYYLASQREGHTPGPMKGVTEQEKRPYLQQPGTVVAVRTNLYQTGKYAGFKEIVDRYVVYPPVPIHYDGPEGSFGYVTQEKFMEVVHSIHPSDDLSQQGVLEFPMTEEQMQELYKELPGLHFNEPPKIVVKCVPLDRYTKSPYLSGVIMCIKTVWEHDMLFLQIRGESVDADILVRVGFDKEKKDLDINISIHVTDSSGKDVDIPLEQKWLENEYCATVCHLKGLPWYQTCFLDAYNRIGMNAMAAHNGVLCGYSIWLFYLTNSIKDYNLETIVLLSDQYRPEMDISRSAIRKLSLEVACDIALIQMELEREGYWINSYSEKLLKDNPWMIPTSVYHSLVQKRPDLEKRLVVDTVKYTYRWKEMEEQIKQRKTLPLMWKIYNLRGTHFGAQNPMGLIEQLSLACLKRDYDLNMSMNGNLDKIYIREKTGRQLELHDDIFPPSLFLYPEEECGYLTRELSENRHFCNASHRFSKFMLKNADLLQEKVPGILKEMIRTLQEESGTKLILGINDLLDRLRSLPNQPIQVSSDLYLTMEDLYCTKEEDEV